MNIYTIYRAINTINNKCYIGFDSNWPSRQKDHIRGSRHSNSVFHRAMRKYGIDKFVWDILYQSYDGQHTLGMMEPHFITENNSYVSGDYAHGYNLTKGGEGTLGYIMSTDTKQKISKSKKGKGSPTGKSDCAFCNNQFSNRRIAMHTKYCHLNPDAIDNPCRGQKSKSTFAPCPYCGTSHRTTSLSRHASACDKNPNRTKRQYTSYTQRTTTCKHCGLTGGAGRMSVYHHDNCKMITFLLETKPVREVNTNED